MVARPMGMGAAVCGLLPSIRHFFAAARARGVSPIAAGQENEAYHTHLSRHSASVEAEMQRRQAAHTAPQGATIH
jgi:hypothetical protein